jgi:DNA repair ATPase RecN
MGASNPNLVKNVNEWKKSKDPRVFAEIYRDLKPYVSYTISKYRDSGISPTSMDLEAKKLIAKALENYNSSKGGVVTYVNQYLQKMNRFVNNNQGTLRLPENYNLEFSTFQNTYNDLKYKQDRDPTTLELADSLAWSPQKIDVFKRKMGGTVIESENSFNRVYKNNNLKVMEALQYIRSKYGHEGETLIAKLYGLNGEQKKSLTQISQEMDGNYAKLYKLKKEVEDDFKEYLNEDSGWSR